MSRDGAASDAADVGYAMAAGAGALVAGPVGFAAAGYAAHAYHHGPVSSWRRLVDHGGRIGRYFDRERRGYGTGTSSEDPQTALNQRQRRRAAADAQHREVYQVVRSEPITSDHMNHYGPARTEPAIAPQHGDWTEQGYYHPDLDGLVFPPPRYSDPSYNQDIPSDAHLRINLTGLRVYDRRPRYGTSKL